MKVIDLIRQLQALPSDARVCVMDENSVRFLSEVFGARVADALCPLPAAVLQIEADAIEIELEPTGC